MIKRDARPTKLVDFEGITRHHKVNIMLYELKEGKGKDAASVWQLVYGKIQHKNGLPAINMGLLGGHCFYIKEMDVLCRQWECKSCRQIFTQNEDLTRYLILFLMPINLHSDLIFFLSMHELQSLLLISDKLST